MLPDFAIDVLSPDDRPSRVASRIAHHLEAGGSLLWVVDPEAQEVTTWQPGKTPQSAQAPGGLDASPILPGFTVELERLFEVLPAE